MEKNVSRKKFLAWSIGISSLLAVPALLKFKGKQRKPATVKMLTRDGKLVEIDAADIPGKKKKVKLMEIQTWINRNTSL